MRRSGAVLCIVLFLSGFVRYSIAQKPDAWPHLTEVMTASALDTAGTNPWHLRMSYQLYDFDGKPSETGTVEEWWSGPSRYRRIVTHSTMAAVSAADGKFDTLARKSFLIDTLLNQVVHPVPDYKPEDKVSVEEANRKFGKVQLTCIAVGRSQIKPSGIATYDGPQYCVRPGTNVLLAVLDLGSFVALRNSIGEFRNIEIGVDNTLSYAGKWAITGHVEVLESYQPSETDPPPSPEPPHRTPGILAYGKLMAHIEPVYPEADKSAIRSGSVLLEAVIGEDGKIESLDVIASSSPSFSEASLDAVKKWVYQPYLVDGKPSKVETTITVHFNIIRY